MSDQTTEYVRASNVLWRLAPDRVLVRIAGIGGTAADLGGVLAVVWTELDRPRRESELAQVLHDAGLAEPEREAADALMTLVAEGVVHRTMAGES